MCGLTSCCSVDVNSRVDVCVESQGMGLFSLLGEGTGGKMQSMYIFKGVFPYFFFMYILYAQ